MSDRVSSVRIEGIFPKASDCPLRLIYSDVTYTGYTKPIILYVYIYTYNMYLLSDMMNFKRNFGITDLCEVQSI